MTAKGVNAMRKIWNVDQLADAAHDVHNLAPKSAARITTPQDRIDTIQDRLVSIYSSYVYYLNIVHIGHKEAQD